MMRETPRPGSAGDPGQLPECKAARGETSEDDGQNDLAGSGVPGGPPPSPCSVPRRPLTGSHHPERAARAGAGQQSPRFQHLL